MSTMFRHWADDFYLSNKLIQLRNLRLNSMARLAPKSPGQKARALWFQPQTGCRAFVLTNSVNLPSATSSPRHLDSAHQFIHKEESRWPVPMAPQCGQVSEEWSQLQFKPLYLAFQTPTIWPHPPSPPIPRVSQQGAKLVPSTARITCHFFLSLPLLSQSSFFCLLFVVSLS